MSYGVTSTGFVLKDLDTLKSELQVDFQGEFGANLELDEREPAGQLIGILSDRFASLWELAEDVYLSGSPDDAVGVSLDNVAGITGTLRSGARNSTVSVTATGTPGTVLPAGRVFRTVDTGARFTTLADATIGGGGTVSVACASVDEGAISAAAGTLTVIETPVSGLASVTNAADALLGAAEQEDPALRVTREQELQGGGKGALPALRAAILKTAGVTACTMFENETDTTNGDGMPPWTFEALVSGGVDADLGETIFVTKGGGAQSHGTTSVTVTDDDGFSHTIKFTRPSFTNVYVIADLSVDASKYPADGDALVQAAIVDWGTANLVSGRDVVSAALGAQAFGIPGVLDCTVYIGTAPAPGSTATIAIAPRAQAVLALVRTTVASTPVTP